MIAHLEHQTEETEGKLSSFHLDNINEAANKLWDYYLSQIAPVYNLMKIYSTTNMVKIRNEMDKGSKFLQGTIWTLNDAVYNKKAFLCAGSRPLEITLLLRVWQATKLL